MIYTTNLSQPIYILIWNANGVIKYKNELKIALHEKNISIALLIETHLCNNQTFSITGYTKHVNNHLDGTAHAVILIKTNIFFTLSFYKTNLIAFNQQIFQ